MEAPLGWMRSGVLPPSVTCQHSFDKKTMGIHLISGCNKEHFSSPFLLITFYKVYHNGFSTWKLVINAAAVTLFSLLG